MLESIIVKYLTYPDIEALRNCCLYLHNFTKDLRLQWRLFPSPRDKIVTRVISLFIHWSKLDSEGVQRPIFPLKDAKLNEICPRFLKLECEDNFCPMSHERIVYDRAELALLGAYIVYTDFMHFVSVIFNPKFLWQYELYITALFEGFSREIVIITRHVSILVIE